MAKTQIEKVKLLAYDIADIDDLKSHNYLRLRPGNYVKAHVYPEGATCEYHWETVILKDKNKPISDSNIFYRRELNITNDFFRASYEELRIFDFLYVWVTGTGNYGGRVCERIEILKPNLNGFYVMAESESESDCLRPGGFQRAEGFVSVEDPPKCIMRYQSSDFTLFVSRIYTMYWLMLPYNDEFPTFSAGEEGSSLIYHVDSGIKVDTSFDAYTDWQQIDKYAGYYLWAVDYVTNYGTTDNPKSLWGWYQHCIETGVFYSQTVRRIQGRLDRIFSPRIICPSPDGRGSLNVDLGTSAYDVQPLRYQWQSLPENATDFENINGATEASYTPTESGTVRCVITAQENSIYIGEVATPRYRAFVSIALASADLALVNGLRLTSAGGTVTNESADDIFVMTSYLTKIEAVPNPEDSSCITNWYKGENVELSAQAGRHYLRAEDVASEYGNSIYCTLTGTGSTSGTCSTSQRKIVGQIESFFILEEDNANLNKHTIEWGKKCSFLSKVVGSRWNTQKGVSGTGEDADSSLYGFGAINIGEAVPSGDGRCNTKQVYVPKSWSGTTKNFYLKTIGAPQKFYASEDEQKSYNIVARPLAKTYIAWASSPSNNMQYQTHLLGYHNLGVEEDEENHEGVVISEDPIKLEQIVVAPTLKEIDSVDPNSLGNLAFGIDYTVQWYRQGTYNSEKDTLDNALEISGANSLEYKTTAKDVGYYLIAKYTGRGAYCDEVGKDTFVVFPQVDLDNEEDLTPEISTVWVNGNRVGKIMYYEDRMGNRIPSECTEVSCSVLVRLTIVDDNGELSEITQIEFARNDNIIKDKLAKAHHLKFQWYRVHPSDYQRFSTDRDALYRHRYIIGGANAYSYIPTSDDVGYYLGVEVSGLYPRYKGSKFAIFTEPVERHSTIWVYYHADKAVPAEKTEREVDEDLGRVVPVYNDEDVEHNVPIPPAEKQDEEESEETPDEREEELQVVISNPKPAPGETLSYQLPGIDPEFLSDYVPTWKIAKHQELTSNRPTFDIPSNIGRVHGSLKVEANPNAFGAHGTGYARFTVTVPKNQ